MAQCKIVRRRRGTRHRGIRELVRRHFRIRRIVCDSQSLPVGTIVNERAEPIVGKIRRCTGRIQRQLCVDAMPGSAASERATIQLTHWRAIVRHPRRLGASPVAARADAGRVAYRTEARTSYTGSHVVRVCSTEILEATVEPLERYGRAVLEPIVDVAAQSIAIATILVVALTPFDWNRAARRVH